VISARRHSRFWIAAGSAVIVFALAGCTGSGTSPTPYSCGTPSTDHCYAELIIGTTDVPGGILGFRTSIGVNSVNGGDGFINEEFWLLSTSGCRCWIETGYQESENLGYYYFWAETVPPGVYGPSHDLGPVAPGDFGGSATFDVQQTGPQSFAITVTTPTASYAATSSNSYLSDPANSGFVEMGQELQGSTGASAGYVFFQDNMEFSGGHWGYIPGGQLDIGAPPYGGWLDPPSSADPGGIFFTECCNSPSSPSSSPAPGPPPAPASSPPPLRQAPGVPALQVSRPRSTGPGQAPGFTAAQAEAYAAAHTPGAFASSSQRAARAMFITAAQLGQVLRDSSTGLAASTPVCYVELNGSFTVEPPPWPGHTPQVLHFPHAYMVFSARTGTLLMNGYLPA
jgi:hypothetical protein